MIQGIASTPTIDDHGQSLASKGCSFSLPVPLLSKHAKFGWPIGEVVLARKSPSQIYVVASLFEGRAADYAWRLVQTGELQCLSVAVAPDGCEVEAEVEGVRFYSKWRLAEVSIVRRGANPDCRFEIRDETAGGFGSSFPMGLPPAQQAKLNDRVGSTELGLHPVEQDRFGMTVWK